MGVPATVWDVAGTGFGTWGCGCGLGQQQKRSIHMRQSRQTYRR